MVTIYEKREVKTGARCLLTGGTQIRKVYRRVRHMLNRAVTIIALGKEAQARKSMRFFFDDRLINELAKAGKRIAKKDVNDI